MDSIPVISLIIILALLVMSAYFSATETAFTSLNRIRIKNAVQDGNKRAELVLKLADDYDTLLSSILIGNNVVNIVLTAIATAIFVGLYGSGGATVSTIVITIVVLLFCEITPKSIAKEAPESFAMFSAPVIRVFMVILTPVNALFSVWKKLVTRVFSKRDERTITEDELITIVEEAETEGGIDEEQSELIQNAIEFNELEAYDVLTPRVDVVAVDITETKEAIGEVFRTSGFSRIPVYDDDMDSVVGVLNQKDFHNYVLPTGVAVASYVKPVVFVPGTIKLNVLLRKMQTVKTHIAVVVDEYGGTEGIVTMEDIIEELVGEIFDEHDEVTEDVLELQDGSYRVAASANLEKILDFFGVSAEADEVTTVNGWVMVETDKIPEKGDSFVQDIGGKRFSVTVTDVDERKALYVNVKVTDAPEAE